MARGVKKTDVKKTDVPVVLDESVVSIVEKIPRPRPTGAYQRLRVALKLLGIGQFEFERVRDDRD